MNEVEYVNRKVLEEYDMDYIQQGHYLKIDFNIDVPTAVVEYIVDCWVTFVTNDLGYTPKDLCMTIR